MTKKLYDTYGSFNGNGEELAKKYGVPSGNPESYGKQWSLLSDSGLDEVSTPVFELEDGPYKDPSSVYGNGPRDLNTRLETRFARKSGALDSKPVLREPTPNNPFMNVMPLDYGMEPVYDDYFRYEKSVYPSRENNKIREEVKAQFDKDLIQNPDGMFWNRENSQRQFITAPVGSVPNNQGEFSNWLYGKEYVCKSGSIWNRYGVDYTDDSLVCNGLNSATPTNMGLLNGKFMSSTEGGSRG